LTPPGGLARSIAERSRRAPRARASGLLLRGSQGSRSGDGYDIWGLSRYAYVEGNPINRVDPTGHCTTEKCWNEVNSSDNTYHGVPGQDKPAASSYTPAPSTGLLTRIVNWFSDNADTVRTFSFVGSLLSGTLSLAAAFVPEAAVPLEYASTGVALLTMSADLGLAAAHKGSFTDVGLDALGLVPALGLWRADLKAASYERELDQLSKTRGWNLTRGARGLKITLGAYDNLKAALQLGDEASAAQDVAKGAAGLINNYMSQFPTWNPKRLTFL